MANGNWKTKVSGDGRHQKSARPLPSHFTVHTFLSAQDKGAKMATRSTKKKSSSCRGDYKKCTKLAVKWRDKTRQRHVFCCLSQGTQGTPGNGLWQRTNLRSTLWLCLWFRQSQTEIGIRPSIESLRCFYSISPMTARRIFKHLALRLRLGLGLRLTIKSWAPLWPHKLHRMRVCKCNLFD